MVQQGKSLVQNPTPPTPTMSIPFDYKSNPHTAKALFYHKPRRFIAENCFEQLYQIVQYLDAEVDQNLINNWATATNQYQNTHHSAPNHHSPPNQPQPHPPQSQHLQQHQQHHPSTPSYPHNNQNNQNRAPLITYLKHILGYGEYCPDDDENGPEPMGIVPWQVRNQLIPTLPTHLTIPTNLYGPANLVLTQEANNVFGKYELMNVTSVVVQMELLITLAIETNYPELLSWLLSPIPNDDLTWDQRIMEANDVINNVRLGDGDIMGDLVKCVSSHIIDGPTRVILFKLLLSSSPRHYRIAKENIDNPPLIGNGDWDEGGELFHHQEQQPEHPQQQQQPRPQQPNQEGGLIYPHAHPHSDPNTYLLRLILNQSPKYHMTDLSPIIKILIDFNIPINFNTHIKPSFTQSELQIAANQITKWCSHYDDLDHFAYIYPILGGPSTFFPSNHNPQTQDDWINDMVAKPWKYPMYNVICDNAVQIFDFLVSQNFPLHTKSEELIQVYLDGMIMGPRLSEDWMGLAMERATGMTNRLCSFQPIFSLLLKNTTSNHPRASFQRGYNQQSSALRAMYGIGDINEKFQFERDLGTKLVKMWNSSSKNLSSLLNFIFSVPTTITNLTLMTPLRFEKLRESPWVKSQLVLDRILLNANAPDRTKITTIPLIFALLARIGNGINYLIGLLDVLLGLGQVSLRTVAMVRVVDPNCGENQFVEPVYQNLTPLHFITIADRYQSLNSPKTLVWNDVIGGGMGGLSHPIEVMIGHFIDAILDNTLDSIHPHALCEIEMEFPLRGTTPRA